MNLISHTVFLIAGFVIENQYYRVFAQNSQHVSESEEDFDLSTENGNNGVATKMLNHTFVALIDILFTDNSRRTCTGTIIHDNVVITAAHCFTKRNRFIKPELAASFVVIGSKHMFETRYEQYLPIERVITHPLYKCWTADLALVFTFANMISDKPGAIIPLAGEKMSTPNHANVTVLSWGHCKEDDAQNDDSWKNRPRFKNHEVRTTATSSMEETEKPPKPQTKKPKRQLRFQVKKNSEPSVETKMAKTKKKHKKLSRATKPVTVGINSAASDEDTDEPPKTHTKKPRRQLRFQVKQNSDPNVEKPKKRKTKKKEKKRPSEIKPVTIGLYRAASSDEDTDEHSRNAGDDEISENLYHSLFNNWRRNMGPNAVSQNNKLTVETFEFVSVRGCKELVKKVKPEKYKMKNVNEYVCYSSEDHYITDEDSGAPAVRHGYLVAVTLGGIECDDDRVAIGIKVSCYCSWIADNLPDGGMNLKCCDHCCEDTKAPPPENAEEDVLRSSKKKRKRI